MVEEVGEVAGRIAVLAKARGARLGAAESLTGGMVCAALASAEDASTWFAGGVVAYFSEVKYEVLGVPQGPVVSETAARAMAEGVARLTGATHAVAVTGVGGPDRQDGEPVGTVWIAVHAGAARNARRIVLEGDPAAICHGAVLHSLLELESALV